MAEKKTAKKSTESKSTKKKTPKKSTAKKTVAAKKSTNTAKKSTDAKKTEAKKTERKPSHMSQSMDFLREQGVIGLAIAVVLGVAAKTAVDGLVAGVINPFIGMFLNADNLSEASFIVSDTALTNGPTEFQYGLFLSGLLNLLVVAAVVYFFVKGVRLDKLDKKKD